MRRWSNARLRISAQLHAKVAGDLATEAAAARSAGPLRPSASLSAMTIRTPERDGGTAGLNEIVRRLQQSESVSRLDLIGPLRPGFDTRLGRSVPADETTPRDCQVRLLESPMFDDGRPIVFGDPAKSGEVEQRLKGLGLEHGPLDDVVVLHLGPIAQLDLLLFVRRELLRPKRVVVRALDADGNELLRVPIGNPDQTPPKPLPARWTDPAGPWAGDIAELLAWPQQGQGWVAVHVGVPEAAAADRVEIGVLPGERPQNGPGPFADGKRIEPAYYVGAIGALRFAEVARSEWDQTQIERDREVITKALGPASSDNALLFADSLYRISVSWSGQRKSDSKTSGDTQRFWFRTDRIGDDGADPPKPLFLSTPPLPVRLDPWILVTLPADGETHAFGGEPTRLVFNTHDVDRVFAAYGKELRVCFQAASARHPEPKPGILHPFPITEATLVPVSATILSPWEDAASVVLAGSCIPVDEARVRHSEVDIPIPLEPFTDYLLDVEMVALGAPAEATGPSIYRRHFSTGGFSTLPGFAASLQAPRPIARYCEPGAMEALRAHFNGRLPQGAELDDQLRTQGLEPLTVPDRARIVVFWSQSGGALPQPEAVLIDATEPLWRSRPYPSQIADDTGPVTAQRWVLSDTDWLTLEDKSPAGVVAPNGIIKAPGAQRGLIVLAAGARGKTLRIDLVSKAFPMLPFLNQTEQRFTLIELPLAHAPWEEV